MNILHKLIKKSTHEAYKDIRRIALEIKSEDLGSL